MSALINRDNMDGALSMLKEFLATVPYCDNTNYEGHYQQLMFVISPFSLTTVWRWSSAPTRAALTSQYGQRVAYTSWN